jgi:hypothetical protein
MVDCLESKSIMSVSENWNLMKMDTLSYLFFACHLA